MKILEQNQPKAVILAGGKGTRLRPYTTVLPKPLMPISEQPILEILISRLGNLGIRDLIISVGHLAELIKTFFAHGEKWNVSICIYVVSEKCLEDIPKNKYFGFDDLIVSLINKGENVCSFFHKGKRQDIGRESDYLLANEVMDQPQD